MATPTYDPIASTTLTSSASSVTFSSLDTIAAGYRDLVLVVDAQTTGTLARSLQCQLNADTGSNYSLVSMIGTGSSAVSSSTTTTQITIGPASGLNRGVGVSQFFDFSQTDKHKSVLIRSDNPASSTVAYAYRWANTSAITSMLLFPSGDLLAAGSVFSLYGIAA